MVPAVACVARHFQRSAGTASHLAVIAGTLLSRYVWNCICTLCFSCMGKEGGASPGPPADRLIAEQSRQRQSRRRTQRRATGGRRYTGDTGVEDAKRNPKLEARSGKRARQRAMPAQRNADAQTARSIATASN